MITLKSFSNVVADELFFINGGSGSGSSSSGSSSSGGSFSGPYKNLSGGSLEGYKKTEDYGSIVIMTNSSGDKKILIQNTSPSPASHVDNKKIEYTPHVAVATGLRG